MTHCEGDIDANEFHPFICHMCLWSDKKIDRPTAQICDHWNNVMHNFNYYHKLNWITNNFALEPQCVRRLIEFTSSIYIHTYIYLLIIKWLMFKKLENVQIKIFVYRSSLTINKNGFVDYLFDIPNGLPIFLQIVGLAKG